MTLIEDKNVSKLQVGGKLKLKGSSLQCPKDPRAILFSIESAFLLINIYNLNSVPSIVFFAKNNYTVSLNSSLGERPQIVMWSAEWLFRPFKC